MIFMRGPANLLSAIIEIQTGLEKSAKVALKKKSKGDYPFL